MYWYRSTPAQYVLIQVQGNPIDHVQALEYKYKYRSLHKSHRGEAADNGAAII